MEKLAQKLVRKFAPKIDQQILGIVIKFIKDRNLIVYGGMAINAYLPPSKKIYDPTVNNPDFDVLSWNSEQDALDLVAMLRENGFSYLRIITGLGGNARRVFVGFTGDSICDFGQLTENRYKKLLPISQIDGISYPSPQFLKIDMYRHFVTGLFVDYGRIEKVQKRIQLLNEEFPFSDGPEPQLMVGPGLSEVISLQEKYFDLVIGGPYLFHFYATGVPAGEAFFLSNVLQAELDTNDPPTNEEIPNMRIAQKLERWSVPVQFGQNLVLGYKGEIFYVQNPQLGRILSRIGLLYYFILLNSDGKYSHYIYELSKQQSLEPDGLNILISHKVLQDLHLPGTVFVQ